VAPTTSWSAYTTAPCSHGATFRCLTARGRPLVAIGATDHAYRNLLLLIQRTFDLICSNLQDFQWVVAVAASNAPWPLSPIQLTNRAATWPLVLRRTTVEVGRPQGFQQGGSREDDGAPRSKGSKRFARSAICILLRGSQWSLPASFVLKFFLDCGRHMFLLVVRSNGGFKQLP
jgi:hypothetical protein